MALGQSDNSVRSRRRRRCQLRRGAKIRMDNTKTKILQTAFCYVGNNNKTTFLRLAPLAIFSALWPSNANHFSLLVYRLGTECSTIPSTNIPNILISNPG